MDEKITCWIEQLESPTTRPRRWTTVSLGGILVLEALLITDQFWKLIKKASFHLVFVVHLESLLWCFGGAGRDGDYDAPLLSFREQQRKPREHAEKEEDSAEEIKMKFKIYLMLQSITKTKNRNGSRTMMMKFLEECVSIGAWRAGREKLEEETSRFTAARPSETERQWRWWSKKIATSTRRRFKSGIAKPKKRKVINEEPFSWNRAD